MSRTVAAVVLATGVALSAGSSSSSVGIRPKFSWDMVGNMTFFHSCNESGLFSSEALDTIVKFPFVTVEKGQGFNDGSGDFAEVKIVAQLKAVKERDPSICTVFYMNNVLSWYFYEMDQVMEKSPWLCLNDSTTHEPVLAPGDHTFNPPKKGMLVFDHAVPAMRQFWEETCLNATRTGYVDGCFCDSSQPDSHGTGNHLNISDRAAYEAGKVETNSYLTKAFGGAAGQPYPANATGVLIGKKSDQLGINAFQIEVFRADEASILELMAGVEQGYLVQAHVEPGNVAACGCACNAMEHTLAAFLIGAGENSYYGTGSWIAAGLEDVQNRWCPELFERPLGPPTGNATKGADGVYRRNFTSGTVVTFNTQTNEGHIQWAGDAPAPAPTPTPAPPAPPGPALDAQCGVPMRDTGVSGFDVANMTSVPDAEACCKLCEHNPSCAIWAWHGEQTPPECHIHSDKATLRRHQVRGCWAGVMVQ